MTFEDFYSIIILLGNKGAIILKKIIAIIAAMAFMLTFFAACGKRKGDVDFSGDNSSKVTAPNNSKGSTTSEVSSSEIKDIEDIWGNVSISVDTDSITSKPSSSKPAESKPAQTSSQSATTSNTSSVVTSGGSSSQVTSSQGTSSKGTTSYTPDDPNFSDWVK